MGKGASKSKRSDGRDNIENYENKKIIEAGDKSNWDTSKRSFDLEHKGDSGVKKSPYIDCSVKTPKSEVASRKSYLSSGTYKLNSLDKSEPTLSRSDSASRKTGLTNNSSHKYSRKGSHRKKSHMNIFTSEQIKNLPLYDRKTFELSESNESDDSSDSLNLSNSTNIIEKVNKLNEMEQTKTLLSLKETSSGAGDGVKSFVDCPECNGKFVNAVLSQGNIKLLKKIKSKERKLEDSKRQLNEERAFYEIQKMDLCKTMRKKHSRSQVVQTDESSLELLSLVNNLEDQVAKLKGSLEKESKKNFKLKEKCLLLRKKYSVLKNQINIHEEDYEKTLRELQRKLNQYKEECKNVEKNSGNIKNVYDKVLKKNSHLSKSNYALQDELKNLHLQFRHQDNGDCMNKYLTHSRVHSTSHDEIYSEEKIKTSQSKKKKRSKISNHKNSNNSSVFEYIGENLVMSGSLISVHIDGEKNNLRPVFLVLDGKNSPSNQFIIGEDMGPCEQNSSKNNERIEHCYYHVPLESLDERHSQNEESAINSDELKELNKSLKQMKQEIMTSSKHKSENCLKTAVEKNEFEIMPGTSRPERPGSEQSKYKKIEYNVYDNHKSAQNDQSIDAKEIKRNKEGRSRSRKRPSSEQSRKKACNDHQKKRSGSLQRISMSGYSENNHRYESQPSTHIRPEIPQKNKMILDDLRLFETPQKHDHSRGAQIFTNESNSSLQVNDQLPNRFRSAQKSNQHKNHIIYSENEKRKTKKKSRKYRTESEPRKSHVESKIKMNKKRSDSEQSHCYQENDISKGKLNYQQPADYIKNDSVEELSKSKNFISSSDMNNIIECKTHSSSVQ